MLSAARITSRLLESRGDLLTKRSLSSIFQNVSLLFGGGEEEVARRGEGGAVGQKKDAECITPSPSGHSLSLDYLVFLEFD